MQYQKCTYDDLLRKNGHFIRGEALHSVRTAKTLRWKGGKVLVTDGPFAETREQLGGLLVLEAKDMTREQRNVVERGSACDWSHPTAPVQAPPPA